MKNLHKVFQKYGVGFRNMETLSDLKGVLNFAKRYDDIEKKLSILVNIYYSLIIKDHKVFVEAIELEEHDGILNGEWSRFTEFKIHGHSNRIRIIPNGNITTNRVFHSPLEEIIFLKNGIKKYPDNLYKMKSLFDEEGAKKEKIEQVKSELLGLIKEYSGTSGLAGLYEELLFALKKDVKDELIG